MAVKIRRFSHQNMTVNVPFEMFVKITGGPEDVSVEGLPDGFYYDWQSNQNRVYIRGTPQRIVFNEDLTIYADNDVRRNTYSVNPLLPVFDQNITKQVFRGVPFSVPVMVENAPVSVTVDGPWIGVRYMVNDYGYHVYGTIPQNAEFTRSRFEYNISVTNQAGTVNGTLVLQFSQVQSSGVHLYILDGSTVRVYPYVGLSSSQTQTINRVRSFTLPDVPGATTNYVALANDGTNLWALHSKPQTDVGTSDDLDDQIVVVSPNTGDGQTAGILNRFSISRISNYYEHYLEDIFHYNNKLYIITRDSDTSVDNSYFVLHPLETSDSTRIITLHATGGGIGVTQNLLTAILYDERPNQDNFFRIYPPSWLDARPLVSDSYDVYTTNRPIATNLQSNSRKVSMTSINNYVYILSSTLTNKLSTVELGNPVTGNATRRNQITLSPGLSDPRGITHL